MKQRKGWRMSCDVGEVTDRTVGEWAELIFLPFHRFTYVTADSPTIPLLHLRHRSFSNPFFASPTSQALHLRQLVRRPCLQSTIVPNIYFLACPRGIFWQFYPLLPFFLKQAQLSIYLHWSTFCNCFVCMYKSMAHAEFKTRSYHTGLTTCLV